MRAGNVEVGYTIEESWIILEDGFRKASLIIRNKIRVVSLTSGSENPCRNPAIRISTQDTSGNSAIPKRIGSGITGRVSHRPGTPGMDLTFRLKNHSKTGWGITSRKNYLMRF